MSLVAHRCWCSIEHAIPAALDRTARETGHVVYCPLGRAAEAETTKARMQVVRHKKRAAPGLCPCCNRSFVGLSRHMKTKHPQYVESP